jgi:hypothetical protein
MVATAWRVLGPVARISGGIGTGEEPRFDQATVQVLRSILELEMFAGISTDERDQAIPSNGSS